MRLSDFGLEGGRRKTLLVLGAGATRGASFVKDVTKVVPFLDKDFFQQLSRMKTEGAERRLLSFIRDEFGSEVGLSMEQFFSEVDYTDRFHQSVSVDKGPHVRRYERALADFMTVLPRMLNAGASADCEYHQRVAALLHAGDCVISFNYDCVMDRALREAAGSRWDPDRAGYGFYPTQGAAAWRKRKKGRQSSTSISLLKLHGSLNWQVRKGGGVALVRDTSMVHSLSGAIIPPSWFKDLEREPFCSVWRRARMEIRRSRILVVIGYSMPPTDLFSRSLFKVEAGSKEKRERLDLVVLVNPDQTARRRFFEIIRGGVEERTSVLEYDCLWQLDQVLKRNTVN